MNHCMYADDTVLIAPSPAALQKLINCCSHFAKDNDMVFNTKKSVCMFVKSKKFKDLVPPEFLLDDYELKYVLKEKYLGFIMSNDCKSDLDINRQMRSIYGRGNILISNFKHRLMCYSGSPHTTSKSVCSVRIMSLLVPLLILCFY